jgi:hypothetical protein
LFTEFAGILFALELSTFHTSRSHAPPLPCLYPSRRLSPKSNIYLSKNGILELRGRIGVVCAALPSSRFSNIKAAFSSNRSSMFDGTRISFSSVKPLYSSFFRVPSYSCYSRRYISVIVLSVLALRIFARKICYLIVFSFPLASSPTRKSSE